MQSNQYKEIFDKIDTDISMDHRIKNKLLYYDVKEEPLNAKSEPKGGHTIFLTPKKGSMLRSLVPSLVIILLVIGGLFAAKRWLYNQNETEIGTSVASNSMDGNDVTMNDEVEISEAMESSDALQDFIDDAGADSNIDSLEEVPDTDVESTDTNLEPTTSLDDIDSNTFEDNTSNNLDTNTPEDNTSNNNQQTDTELIAPKSGDFYFASFEVVSNGTIKSAIPQLSIRFRGRVTTMDPKDITDIVLTRDGIPIDNPITFTGDYYQFTWGYEDVTDFYFDFQDDNRTPGTYHLTGKYQGRPFEVYDKIIEETITDEPANENDLIQVGWAFYPDEKGSPKEVSELVFHFRGRQNTFYQSDLTELKGTKDGQEISFSFRGDVFRYYEYGYERSDTSFNLILNNVFTQSGTYLITGKYRGKEFISQDIVIP